MAYRKTKRSWRKPTSRRTTIRRRSKSGSPWSREEIAFLRKNYRYNETKWVARQLGRSVYSVRYKASDLSIRKANPSSWKGHTGNKKTSRPSSRWTRKPAQRRRTTSRTRWAKTTRRTTRKPAKRKNWRRI
jgi:hypothetical protein